jgi:hypothetical protein
MPPPRTASTAAALLATAAATATGAAPAAAAPPWTAPQTVATAAARSPALAFGSGGLGVGSLGTGAAATRVLSVRVGADAPLAASRVVATIEDGPLPYARTRTVSLRGRTAAGRATTLGWSLGRTDGALGTARTLRTAVLRPGEAELAVSPNGNAVIAFVEERGGSTRLWLSTRRAAGRFTSPRVVRGSGSARSVSVSVNDRGRFVLAYALGAARTRVVEARIGTTAGSLGGVRIVGQQLGLARTDAVVAPTGRATVAWTTRDGGEEQNDPTQLRTNVAPAGRSTFAGQVVLDRAVPGALGTEPTPPSLAATPDGTTAVAYTLSGRFSDLAGQGNFLTPARVSVQDAAARFGAPQELSPDAVVGRIAARADGTFAVPYVTGVPLEGGRSELRVALGTRTFRPGELVAEDADQDAAVAFEPGPAGAPVVLWTRALGEGAAIARRSPVTAGG